MAFSLTDVSPYIVSERGGFLIEIAGIFEQGHEYRVHIGHKKTTEDSLCQSGIPGKSTSIPFVSPTKLRAYTPMLAPTIVNYSILVVDIATLDQQLLSEVLQVTNRQFQTSVYSYKSVFPPHWKTGPRNIELEKPTN